MLKQWMLNPDTHAISVEEKYRSWCQQLRSDKYVTVGVSTCFVVLPKCAAGSLAGYNFPTGEVVRQVA